MPSKIRDFKKEYKYQGTPKQIANRTARNAARRELEKEGAVHKGDGKDVNHKKPICKGGKNNRSNLEVTSASKNRSFARNKKAGMK